nr:N-acetylmuramoyl-L-alanine amidase [Bacteroides sp.]
MKLVRMIPLRMLLVAVMVVGSMLCTRMGAFTVVLDPGHGGSDVGAVGATVKEKDVNLAVAKRVGKLIESNIPGVKVVYTRSTDVFIPLQERCNVANRVKGDIFVSIHTNSVAADSPNRKTVNGASVYTLGLNRAGTNLDVAMRENSVMQLEDDYTATYSGFDPNSAESYIMFELHQSSNIEQSLHLAKNIQTGLVEVADRKDNGVRQAPFWVLVRTSMPAVLVELDFICNPDVECYLGCDEGRDNLADAVFQGISRYIASATTIDVPKVKPRSSKPKASEKKPAKKAEKASTPEAPAKAADDVDNNTILYKVQFLTSPRPLAAGSAAFKGIEDADSYRDGNVVKYTVGSFKAPAGASELLREVKKKFPDAFIIKMKGGERVK